MIEKYGANKLAELTLELEKVAKAADECKVGDTLQDLLKRADQLKKEIEEEKNKL